MGLVCSFNDYTSLYHITKNFEEDDQESARIYGFCETHPNEALIKQNCETISALYEEGDVILVEGCEGTSKNDPRYQGMFPKNAIVNGWDSEKALCENMKIKNKVCHILTRVEQLKSEHSDAGVPMKDLRQVIDDAEKVIGAELIIKSGEEEFLDKKRFMTISSNILGILGKHIVSFSGDLMMERNESLVKYAKKNLTEKNKIFIIAGASHLKIDEKNKSHQKVAQYVFDAFKDHNYSIFESKDTRRHVKLSKQVAVSQENRLQSSAIKIVSAVKIIFLTLYTSLLFVALFFNPVATTDKLGVSVKNEVKKVDPWKARVRQLMNMQSYEVLRVIYEYQKKCEDELNKFVA